MKRHLMSFVSVAALTLVAGLVTPAQADPLVATDVGGVLGSGSGGATAPSRSVKIAPALYEISDLDHKWSTEYYMLVDSYVNDPSKNIAILFSAESVEKSRGGIAHVYQGRPVKDGKGLMFSPLAVDNSGNLRVQSEVQTDAPVIEVLSRSGDFRYPYVLRGRNGALNGRILGMRASGRAKPQLHTWPSSGVFASVRGGAAEVMVDGNEISLFNGTTSDQTYNLVAINGDKGKFAALTKSTFDTMGEYELADEQAKKLATFVTGCFDRETLIVLNPSIQWGEYNMQLFRLAEASWLERLFPGRRTPPKKN